MSNRQKIALVTPVLLIVFMLFVYRQLAQIYGSRIAWYTGFWVYWGIWCAFFPLLIVGKRKVLELIRPRKPRARVLLLVAFPLLMTVMFRILSRTDYIKPNMLWTVLCISTAFGNGFFEEILWRGVYMSLFPRRIFYRMIWPAFWFALWHYAPGSVSPNSNVVGLIVGSGLFGLYLAFLAKKTGTIWWCIVAHTLGGIVMVV
ncbi:MAG: CPBP family intramembrane metalloprotease [candidate division WOR-3 bacterium]|jgi:membrane protease YdiL (CAAX protease family)